MQEIKLTQGKVALVDDADNLWLTEQYKWWADLIRDTWYARGRGWRREPETGLYVKVDQVLMHREIRGAEATEVHVDHRDGDGLNNQRSNLRLVTNAENHMNMKPQEGGTSRFKGVYWNKGKGKWQAQISLNGTRTSLGRYDTEEQAAAAYDEAATTHFGEFARLNFPGDAS